ncbi:MAG: AarF/ABC1/UbiB kinase family protein, partial [Elusimicrobia bacterium]|nr:AarF/ABC1/UbiB kinase family protein [Elusimicrobiota bacterium]
MLERAARIRRTFRHLQRFRGIVRVFLKYGYQDVAQRLHLPTLLDLPLVGQSTEIAELPAGERFRRACEELGPTFVKLGQVLSTRPDLLPEGFADELTKLQDAAAPLPFSEIRRVLDLELKGRTDDLFSSIDETPLGSASMAQAHAARLRSGESVVVKVQRPGIRHTLTVDIEILREFAELMEEHIEGIKRHRPRRAVEELIRKLESELDFSREAANAERFAAQFEGDPTVHVPRIYREATTTRLITMEFIEGVKANQAAAADGLDAREVAARLSDLVLRQIFLYGFFHADPHPGNVRVLPGNVICFLDYGQMGYLDGSEREDFADLLAGVAKRDASHVAQALGRLGAGAGGSMPGLEADA